MQTISWTELYPSEQTANDRIRAAVGDDARYYDMQAIGNEYYAAIDKAIEELNCFCTGNGVITDNAGVTPEDIRAAIDHAAPGDIVLICGRGHEDKMMFGADTVHFDDREEARYALLMRAVMDGVEMR